MRAAALTLLLTLAAPAAAQVCRPALPPLNPCTGSQTVRIAAVGDVMMHRAVQRRGYAYGFPGLWAAAAPWFRGADIAVANLETPTAPGFRPGGRAGPDPGPVFDDRVYSGYPLFNAHPGLIDALRAAGVTVVTTANNPALDRGPTGLAATLDELDRRGMHHTGAIRPGAPRDFVLRLRTRIGTLALIGCSYDTNGIPGPHRQVLLCYRDRAELLGLVAHEAGRGAGVIVFPHWGAEYQHQPQAIQRDLGRALVAAGALAAIGAHPHVIQPWEAVPGPMGQGLIAYSTGNFVSSQRSLPRATGMIALADICRGPTGLTVGAAGWVATLTAVDAQGLVVAIPDADADGTARQARALVERLVPGRAAGPCDPSGT
jgi:poly-gamma-glutamate synthesis protein (capsule biosynthesis protein)